jgi:hypothetical protein
MTTRFERIAAAYPLHAQRIAEATYNESRFGLKWLQRDAGVLSAGAILSAAFYWGNTREGNDYWCALCMGDVTEQAEAA